MLQSPAIFPWGICPELGLPTQAHYHPQEMRAAKSFGRWGTADGGKKLVRTPGFSLCSSLPSMSNLQFNQQLTTDGEQTDKHTSDPKLSTELPSQARVNSLPGWGVGHL